jgi:xanthine dehydrogenase accessory factor
MSAAKQTVTGSRGIFAEIVRLQRSGRRAVLATPLWHSGSVPLTAESKLLFLDDGSMLGTVGGGLLEAGVLAAAPEVLAQAKARVLEFELTQDQAARSGMICGGRCAVLIEPLAPETTPEVFAAVAGAAPAGDPIVLITLLLPDGTTCKLALRSDGDLVGGPVDADTAAHLREAAAEALASERPHYAEEPVRAHVDPILPRPTVFIFGAGHVAIPVAHIAGLVGFRVVVTDDRAEFANRERFPFADEVMVAAVEEAFEALHVHDDGYVVAITRGHAMDEEVVAHALRTPARYIGMIGSKRKVAGVLGRLREHGFSDADLARVHAPIGVDIEAETVEEIAVSIVAELIAVRRRNG